MSEQPVPNVLAEFLNLYCDVNAMDMVYVLRDNLAQKKIPEEKANLFRQQLAEAINYQTVTPKQYKELTGDNEYNTTEELETWLKELWQELFGDRRIG